FWFEKSGLPAVTRTAPLSGQQTTNERRCALLQKNFDKFVPVHFEKDADCVAAIHHLRVRENTFESEGRYYCGFKFTVPTWRDGDFEWMYVFARTEAERDLATRTSWGIIPQSGTSSGFEHFMRNGVAQYPRLQRQFPNAKG